MEATISAFCQSLSAFCNHLQSSSQALTDAVHRRPIPLDSAASAFLQSLERRLSSAAADLDLLDSMALGTVSFEELLGHCNEVFAVNRRITSELETRMIGFGYVPEIELDDGEEELPSVDSKFLCPINASNGWDFGCGSLSAAWSNRKRVEEDELFEDSVALQNLGLSDATLATLASEEDNDKLTAPATSSRSTISHSSGVERVLSFSKEISDASGEDSIGTKIKASKDDYECLPSITKGLASWEELQDAVTKINSYLCGKDGALERDTIKQDELETLGLGRKAKTYILLLYRMNQLAMETVDGSVLYRVRAACS